MTIKGAWTAPAPWRWGAALLLAACLSACRPELRALIAGAQVDPAVTEPILLQDQFSDPTQTVFGHTPYLSRSAALTFVSGSAELRKTVAGAGGGAEVRLPGEYEDTSLAVDAWLVEPDSADTLALECRAHADFSAYRLTVAPQNRLLRIDRYDGVQGTILMNWTPSSQLFSDGRRHRFELHCVGPTIAAAIDGVIVAATSDERYDKGASGFLAGGRGFTRVRLDNLTLIARNPAGPLGQLLRLPAPGTALLSDDFSDPATGWLLREATNPARVYRYVDGEYEIAKLDEGEAVPGGVWLPGSYDNAALAVDVRMEPRETGQGLNLSCRDSRAGSSYEWMVDLGTGGFYLFRVDSDGSTVLHPPSVSEAIRPFPEWNRLEVLCRGSTIALAANGEEVASVEDATYGQGQFYLGVLGEDGRAAARFDNLVIIGY